MSTDSLGYVVVTFNQASHQAGLPMAADLHTLLADAINARDWERAETAKVGRGEHHVVAEVFEVDEDEIPGELERDHAAWAPSLAVALTAPASADDWTNGRDGTFHHAAGLGVEVDDR